MKIKEVVSIYPMIIGLLMIGMWSILLITGQVSELDTAPLEISYHLFAEFLTAVLLFLGGYALYKNEEWGFKLFLVSMGLLLYSVINAAGYYIEQGEIVMFGVFTLLMDLTLLFIILGLLKSEKFET